MCAEAGDIWKRIGVWRRGRESVREPGVTNTGDKGKGAGCVLQCGVEQRGCGLGVAPFSSSAFLCCACCPPTNLACCSTAQERCAVLLVGVSLLIAAPDEGRRGVWEGRRGKGGGEYVTSLYSVHCPRVGERNSPVFFALGALSRLDCVFVAVCGCCLFYLLLLFSVGLLARKSSQSRKVVVILSGYGGYFCCYCERREGKG